MVEAQASSANGFLRPIRFRRVDILRAAVVPRETRLDSNPKWRRVRSWRRRLLIIGSPPDLGRHGNSRLTLKVSALVRRRLRNGCYSGGSRHRRKTTGSRARTTRPRIGRGIFGWRNRARLGARQRALVPTALPSSIKRAVLGRMPMTVAKTYGANRTPDIAGITLTAVKGITGMTRAIRTVVNAFRRSLRSNR